MSWNEWKVAGVTPLREHFFLYLVGNLRADLKGAMPFVRTVRDPVGQMVAEAQVERIGRRRMQLAVHHFDEAEHLDLTVVHGRGNASLPAAKGK